MTPLQNAIWYSSIGIELAALIRLARVGRHPWLIVYLCLDVARWATLMVLDRIGGYVSVWTATEGVMLAFLLAAVLESIDMDITVGYACCCVIGVGVAWSWVSDNPCAVPMRGVLLWPLALSLIWRLCLKPGRRVALMLLFVLSDIVCITAIHMGGVGDVRPGVFLIYGQFLALCGLALWPEE